MAHAVVPGKSGTLTRPLAVALYIADKSGLLCSRLSASALPARAGFARSGYAFLKGTS